MWKLIFGGQARAQQAVDTRRGRRVSGSGARSSVALIFCLGSLGLSVGLGRFDGFREVAGDSKIKAMSRDIAMYLSAHRFLRDCARSRSFPRDMVPQNGGFPRVSG